MIFRKLLDRLKRLFKNYYCIKQHDMTDCGAACLATVAKQYGLKVPIARIREVAATDTLGTNISGMIKAAEKLDFIAKGVKGNKKVISQNKIPLPAIAHVTKDGYLDHYVVIHEITKEEIIIADPDEGIVYYKHDEFFEIWSKALILLSPSQNFKSRDETKGFFDRFFVLIKERKRLLIEVFIASMIYTVFGIISAFYFRYLIDEILVDDLKNILHIFSIGFIFLIIFKILLNAFREHLILYLSQKIDVTLILNYYQHILKLPMSFFDRRKVGEILSRLSDASRIRQAISGATITVMIDTILLLIGGVVLYVQSPKLFFMALITIPFYILVILGFNKQFKTMHRKEMEQKAKLESYLVESVSGVATIKSFNAEKEANLETENRFIKMIRLIFKVSWLKNIQSSLQSFINSLGELAILWIGGLQVIEGNITIGQLITINALAAYFFGPIQDLVGLHPMLQEAYIAGDRLGEILDLETEKEKERDKVKINKLDGEIELKNIDFSYGTREKVLKDINLKIKPGEKVALVGESGSGKTTLVKLLLKYYLPEEGEILIDNYNIKDLNTEFLRDQIGYVPQDVLLFSGTIKENIAFGDQHKEMKEVIAASQKAKAHQFINKLSARYNTLVGERGANLSGGQKQRIAIARAILKSPELLILDEATSNLDTITEKAIHNTIKEISEDVTTIIIAHRLSTIRHCDRIILLDDGKIVEQGSHEELLEKKGDYYKLWSQQFAE